METHTALREQVAFYLRGRRPGAGPAEFDALALRPALLAHYRDLTRLRYDFPLVLADGVPAGPGCLRSLTSIVDDTVREGTQDAENGRLERHALRLEREIRASVAAGATGRLSTLWDEAAQRLAAAGDDRLRDSLTHLRSGLRVDGQVIDCDRAMPARLLRHAWSAVQDAKAERAQSDIARLILKLSEILRADLAQSAAGRSAESLQAAVGGADTALFDFETLSRLLARSTAGATLPESRRRRIERLLAVLKSQRFFGAPRGVDAEGAGILPYAFVFHDCAAALAAYRERLPQAVELARAIEIAELEIDSRYDEERHGPLFAEFGADGLDADGLARFPDYLVILDAAALHGAERETLMELLAAGLPVKVLVQTDDLLADSGIGGESRLTFGRQSRQLASMAIGLDEVYVLQVSASQLYQSRGHVLDGLDYAGPALFSVFSGAGGRTGGLPPYLVAAAAVEARVFPTLSYDPSAGDSWAERFELTANPQVERDWPVRPFAYEDEQHQRHTTELAFTLADFVACDQRFARHFAGAPWSGDDHGLVPVDAYLTLDAGAQGEAVPFLLTVDDDDRLRQVIVDERLIQATRRSRDAWHSLQELAGIHNSHAERLLARERAAWEAELRQARPEVPVPGPAPDVVVVAAATPAATPEVAPDEAEAGPSPDEAYVETARCSSCNECIQINPNLFAYDENKQCRIVNLDAGTYRDLVEAAENCQVAIIHPGKPRNPNEPGLDELLKRAEPFR